MRKRSTKSQEIVHRITPHMERFCQEYIVDLNGTQAALRALYPPRGAGQQACRLLRSPVIMQRIAELQANLVETTQISAERVIGEYAKIAFSNIQDCMKDSNAVMSINKLPKNVAAAIESVHYDIRHDSGKSTGYTQRVQVKFHSKIAALDALSKHLGLYQKDNEQRGMTVADMMALAESVRVDD